MNTNLKHFLFYIIKYIGTTGFSYSTIPCLNFCKWQSNISVRAKSFWYAKDELDKNSKYCPGLIRISHLKLFSVAKLQMSMSLRSKARSGVKTSFGMIIESKFGLFSYSRYFSQSCFSKKLKDNKSKQPIQSNFKKFRWSFSSKNYIY